MGQSDSKQFSKSLNSCRISTGLFQNQIYACGERFTLYGASGHAEIRENESADMMTIKGPATKVV